MAPNTLEKSLHHNFLKQTKKASTHFEGEQTHLWREDQEMGGLVRGGAVRATCVKAAPTGSAWL
jgi:hypothetical protein